MGKPTPQNGGGSFPEPHIEEILGGVVQNGGTGSITITGSYLTEDIVVTVSGGLTVDNVTFVRESEIVVGVTAGTTDGTFDITVTTAGGTETITGGVEVLTIVATDLRAGNTYTIGTGNPAGTEDILMRAGMTMLQDSDGMYFTGANPRQSWVLFNMLKWQRGQNKTCKIMFSSPSAAMMLGIGSDAIGAANNSQFYQHETVAYLNSATNFWGLFGNNGTVGGAGNQSAGQAINGNSFYRVEFTQDGSAGGTFSLYEVPDGSISSFIDTSNLITQFTIGGGLNPDEIDIMPSIIPRVDGQRFIFLSVE